MCRHAIHAKHALLLAKEDWYFLVKYIIEASIAMNRSQDYFAAFLVLILHFWALLRRRPGSMILATVAARTLVSSTRLRSAKGHRDETPWATIKSSLLGPYTFKENVSSKRRQGSRSLLLSPFLNHQRSVYLVAAMAMIRTATPKKRVTRVQEPLIVTVILLV